MTQHYREVMDVIPFINEYTVQAFLNPNDPTNAEMVHITKMPYFAKNPTPSLIREAFTKLVNIGIDRLAFYKENLVSSEHYFRNIFSFLSIPIWLFLWSKANTLDRLVDQKSAFLEFLQVCIRNNFQNDNIQSSLNDEYQHLDQKAKFYSQKCTAEERKSLL
jgi:hypothetical protein